MEKRPEWWMAQQQQAGRRLCLVLQGESEARGALLATRTVAEYCSLYGETVAAELAAHGPMILLLDHVNEPGLVGLLQTPQRNWGWLGSLPGEDLRGVAGHWRDRLVAGPPGRQVLYRFHDNRTLARALDHLPAEGWPAFLGPLISVCYWQGERWCCGDNPAPGAYPVPDPAPWLQVPNPQAGVILQANILRYLLAEYSEALSSLAEFQDPRIWLEQLLEQARAWQWERPEQLEFLVVRQLVEATGDVLIRWQPLRGEGPEDHFQRVVEEWRRVEREQQDA
ncbi:MULTISPECIES: DUF4123 domain-containing protein [unclassified Pseudomonas]|uniref:DUF4123 domain-containing protein n=1 Tax=unclassified Pseudomonas TaxID=196821 RepID=UPI0015A2EE8E|nr:MULTISPECIES: DUF4123 domain-containing protein [unclassified Pseudomonas]NWC96177.1 DUF4123 domain-containing protein [Pseudomonas sp. IPO3779]NWD16797.1 DUF4123 domain-containing protein [Pseudomonas sp. IPO3778]